MQAFTCLDKTMLLDYFCGGSNHLFHFCPKYSIFSLKPFFLLNFFFFGRKFSLDKIFVTSKWRHFCLTFFCLIQDGKFKDGKVAFYLLSPCVQCRYVIFNSSLLIKNKFSWQRSWPLKSVVIQQNLFKWENKKEIWW